MFHHLKNTFFSKGETEVFKQTREIGHVSQNCHLLPYMVKSKISCFLSLTEERIGIFMKLGRQVHLMLVQETLLQIVQILSRTGDIHQAFFKKMMLKDNCTLARHELFISQRKNASNLL